MAYNDKIDGIDFSSPDFVNTDLFAQVFEQFIGASYEHIFRQWTFPIFGWSADNQFLTANWNSEAANVVLAPGSFVCCYSRAAPNSYAIYGQVTAVGFSGAYFQVTVSILGELGTIPTASNNVRDWQCSVIGVTAIAAGGTLASASGGTGQTTGAAAKSAEGLIAPATASQILTDDFLTYGTDVPGSLLGDTRYNRPGLFYAKEGQVNMRAHSNGNTMSRFPEIKLASHPGLCQQYVVSPGDAATIAMGHPFSDTLPGGILFSGSRCTYEWMFKMGGPNKINGGWSLRIGLTSNTDDVLANEIGIGVRAFNQSPTDGNVLRLYASVGGVFKNPTAGAAPYTGTMEDYYPNSWFKVMIIRSASGNAVGTIYGYDEDGNQYLTAALGEITAANLPTGTLRPFCRLEKRTNAAAGYIEMLSDYFQFSKVLAR